MGRKEDGSEMTLKEFVEYFKVGHHTHQKQVEIHAQPYLASTLVTCNLHTM